MYAAKVCDLSIAKGPFLSPRAPNPHSPIRNTSPCKPTKHAHTTLYSEP